MNFSMNGFRSNLSSDVAQLRRLVKRVVDGDYDITDDKYELIEAMDAVINASNGLNCVSIEGDDSFIEMGEVCVPGVDDDDPI